MPVAELNSNYVVARTNLGNLYQGRVGWTRRQRVSCRVADSSHSLKPASTASVDLLAGRFRSHCRISATASSNRTCAGPHHLGVALVQQRAR